MQAKHVFEFNLASFSLQIASDDRTRTCDLTTQGALYQLRYILLQAEWPPRLHFLRLFLTLGL